MLLSGIFVVVVNGQTVLREKKEKERRLVMLLIPCRSQNTRDSSILGAVTLIVNHSCNGL